MSGSNQKPRAARATATVQTEGGNRALRTLLVIAVIGPLAAISAWALFGGGYMPSGRPQLSEAEKIAANWKVPGLGADEAKNRAYKSITDPAAVNTARRVRVGALMTFAEIIGKDPPPASPLEYTNFANARAGRAAQAECKLVEQAFAAKCEAGFASVRPFADDMYFVNMSLLFTNKQALGSVDSSGDLELVETKAPLRTPSTAKSPVAFTQQADERLALYRAAAGKCDRHREAYGNCALLDILVATSADRRVKGVVTMDGEVTFVSLAKREKSAAR